MKSGGRAPHILLVAHDIDFMGGMEGACAELIRRLSGTVDFTILSRTLAPELRSLVHWHRVPAIRRPFPLKFLIFYAVAGFQVSRLRPDIVHTMGAIVPNRVDLATVHLCHAGFRKRAGLFSPADAPLARRLNTGLTRLLALCAERWSYRPERTRLLAAVSDGAARELSEHYPGSAVEVTRNGVDTDRFRQASSDGPSLRPGAKDGPDDVVVLFVGGDWHRKGLALAVEALAWAQRQVTPRLVLWVVGAGDHRHFRAIARECGVGDQVRFFGPQREVERFYQSADIFVLPSLYETFSLVAYEAAACQVPVIATRVSGIQELVGDDEAGVLVDRTPHAVGDAIRRLAAEPETRVRMGKIGQRRAQSFTWDESVQQVFRLYDRLVDEKRIVDVRVEVPSSR